MIDGLTAYMLAYGMLLEKIHILIMCRTQMLTSLLDYILDTFPFRYI